MSVYWILEKYVHEENRENFITAIKKYQHKYKVFDCARDTFDIIGSNYFKRPFVAYAGIEFISDLQISNSIDGNPVGEPVTIASFQNFECTEYYKYYRGFLFNKDYVYATVQDLLDNWDFYLNLFQSNKIFIRSNSGKKKLTGQCFTIDQKKEFEEQIDIYRTNKKEWLLIAPFKKIKREWRFVVCEDKIITGCCYASFDMDEDDPHYFEAQEYAQNMINSVDFAPDPVYIMDVCLGEDGFDLLELNSFSCSGLYDCDIDIVVKEVSKVAWKIFNWRR